MVELTKAAVLKKLKTVAGFKELTNKQMMTRLASLAQDSVKNALKAAKFKGGAVGVALTVLGMGAEAALSKNQKARNRRKNIDPSAGKPDELQTEPMDSSKDRTGRRLSPVPSTKTKPKPSYSGGQRKTTPKDSPKKIRPKPRPKSVEKSSAPRTSLRPKLRPKK